MERAGQRVELRVRLSPAASCDCAAVNLRASYIKTTIKTGGVSPKEELNMKELLPMGSVVTIQGTSKKVMIIGILQMQQENSKLYDYLAVPYPEGFVSAKRNLLFNHESINDVIFTGYTNPERDGFMKLMSLAYEKAVADKDTGETLPNDAAVSQS